MSSIRGFSRLTVIQTFTGNPSWPQPSVVAFWIIFELIRIMQDSGYSKEIVESGMIKDPFLYAVTLWNVIGKGQELSYLLTRVLWTAGNDCFSSEFFPPLSKFPEIKDRIFLIFSGRECDECGRLFFFKCIMVFPPSLVAFRCCPWSSCCGMGDFRPRTVWLGHPEKREQRYPKNVINNQKYNFFTFLPGVSVSQRSPLHLSSV